MRWPKCIHAFTRLRSRSWCSSGLSIVLLLFAGNFRQLFSLAIFAEWLFYLVSTTTVFVLRKREPNATRLYRTWGYPMVPAMFVAAAAVLLYYTFTENIRNSAWGVIVIAAGVPIYAYFARKRKKQLAISN